MKGRNKGNISNAPLTRESYAKQENLSLEELQQLLSNEMKGIVHLRRNDITPGNLLAIRKILFLQYCALVCNNFI